MSATGTPHVLFCAGRPQDVEDVCRPLEAAGFVVTPHAFAADEPERVGAYHLVLVEGSRDAEQALRYCRRLRARLGDDFVPILFVTDDHGTTARLASLEAGADTYLLRPFAPGELLAQARAFVRIRGEHDRLTEKTAEVRRVNHRLRQAYQQIDGELELARRIQRSFLPQEMPQVSGARFAAHFEMCGHVGGDFYDVFRLDESHVGLYVADAMGHGVPAALLTIFVKKGVRAKEVFGKQYRLVPPAEVLGRLNRDLVEQALSDQPFITMIYALFDHRERTLRFARAGHPHPLYLPRDGEPCRWEVNGSLLGIFETSFAEQTHRLNVGDKVLLYSDGIDGARFGGCEPGLESLLACAVLHRARPVEELVPLLVGELFATGERPDDLTLLGLEVV